MGLGFISFRRFSTASMIINSVTCARMGSSTRMTVGTAGFLALYQSVGITLSVLIGSLGSCSAGRSWFIGFFGNRWWISGVK